MASTFSENTENVLKTVKNLVKMKGVLYFCQQSFTNFFMTYFAKKISPSFEKQEKNLVKMKELLYSVA